MTWKIIFVSNEKALYSIDIVAQNSAFIKLVYKNITDWKTLAIVTRFSFIIFLMLETYKSAFYKQSTNKVEFINEFHNLPFTITVSHSESNQHKLLSLAVMKSPMLLLIEVEHLHVTGRISFQKFALSYPRRTPYLYDVMKFAFPMRHI